jgi:L-ribulose-5-phosphate 4-epimerase
LVAEGLVIQTWGNVSGVDRERGLMVIKPSGVAYAGMKPQHMVAVSLADGKIIEGRFKPSSDTATHLELYRAFKNVGGIVHTHSLYATAWAQAQKKIPALGTTQADYWFGDVPCTRALTAAEIKNDYEKNTGGVIVEIFRKLNPLEHPAVLVASHGPFCWGKNVADAVHNAGVLEFIARLASETLRINPKTQPMQSHLLDKHFLRKHGSKAYYGQK